MIEVKAPTPKPKVPIERPPYVKPHPLINIINIFFSDDEPFSELKVVVSNSLKTSLARLQKQQENKDVSNTSESTDNATNSNEVAIGTECKHGGCQTVSIYCKITCY